MASFYVPANGGQSRHTDLRLKEKSNLITGTPGSIGKNDSAFQIANQVCLPDKTGVSVNTYSVTPMAVNDDQEVAILTIDELRALVTLARNNPDVPALSADIWSWIKLLREMGFSGKATIKTWRGKKYVVLGGYPGLRKFLKGTRYSFNNPKILQMVIGKAGVAKSVMKGSAITMIVASALSVVEVFLNDQATLQEIGVTLVSDLSKAALSGLASFAAGALIASLTTVAVAPLAGAIIVGVLVGIGLDALDEKFEITKKMQEYVDNLIKDTQAKADRVVDRGLALLGSLIEEAVQEVKAAVIRKAERELREFLRNKPIPWTY